MAAVTAMAFEMGEPGAPASQALIGKEGLQSPHSTALISTLA